jgi:hypothetical protein
MTLFKTSRRGVRTTLAAATAGALLTGLLGASPATADGTATPWTGQDQNALGGLTFYDASGNVITSGRTDVAPFAAFIQGRKTIRAGDSVPNLFAYSPMEGVSPEIWSNDEALGLSANYPNSSAPGALATSTLPVNSGTSQDLTLDTFASDYPNPSTTAGYQNVYEIRLYTNAPQNTMPPQYDYADISIDSAAHTWTLVYTPSDAAAPGAPTGVHASAGNGTASVAWTAPANDGGSAITGYTLQYSVDKGAHWTTTTHNGTSRSQAVSGLTNGKSYVFRVAARNVAGTGSFSSASSAVTPVADASKMTNSLSSSLKYGATGKFWTRLTDSHTGAVLSGRWVSLYRRGASNQAWKLVKSVKTASSGYGTVSYKPSTSGQYEWRYTGENLHEAAASGITSQSVAQVVSAHAVHPTIRHGSTLTIYGTISPAASGQQVSLQQQVNKSWKGKTTAKERKQKLPNHKTAVGFVLKLKIKAKGKYKFRVYKPSASGRAAGYSTTVSVKVT